MKYDLILGAGVSNPVPATTSISPTNADALGDEFTLTVNGSNFISSSTVQWNGSDRVTTYVSANQLTAVIPASDLTTDGTAEVTVVNPAPGGGTSNAQTFTINWVPGLITGLTLWLRSDLGITKDVNNRVSVWADQAIGPANNFSQDTGSLKPTWTPATINGHPVLVFNSSGDHVIDNYLNSSFNQGQPDTWFVVFKLLGSGYSFIFDQGPGGAERQLFGRSGDNTYTIYATAAEVKSVGLVNSSPHYASIIFNGASSQVWLDGGSIISGNPGSQGIGNAQLGLGVGGAGLYGGWLAELICYNGALSTLNRQTVEAYLATRYGL